MDQTEVFQEKGVLPPLSQALEPGFRSVWRLCKTLYQM
nr:MAG TPA: hypothetical protein [Caudoviricetes sp.]